MESSAIRHLASALSEAGAKPTDVSVWLWTIEGQTHAAISQRSGVSRYAIRQKLSRITAAIGEAHGVTAVARENFRDLLLAAGVPQSSNKKRWTVPCPENLDYLYRSVCAASSKLHGQDNSLRSLSELFLDFVSSDILSVIDTALLLAQSASLPPAAFNVRKYLTALITDDELCRSWNCVLNCYIDAFARIRPFMGQEEAQLDAADTIAIGLQAIQNLLRGRNDLIESQLKAGYHYCLLCGKPSVASSKDHDRSRHPPNREFDYCDTHIQRSYSKKRANEIADLSNQLWERCRHIEAAELHCHSFSFSVSGKVGQELVNHERAEHEWESAYNERKKLIALTDRRIQTNEQACAMRVLERKERDAIEMSSTLNVAVRPDQARVVAWEIANLSSIDSRALRIALVERSRSRSGQKPLSKAATAKILGISRQAHHRWINQHSDRSEKVLEKLDARIKAITSAQKPDYGYLVARMTLSLAIEGVQLADMSAHRRGSIDGNLSDLQNSYGQLPRHMLAIPQQHRPCAE